MSNYIDKLPPTILQDIFETSCCDLHETELQRLLKTYSIHEKFLQDTGEVENSDGKKTVYKVISQVCKRWNALVHQTQNIAEFSIEGRIIKTRLSCSRIQIIETSTFKYSYMN